MDVDDVLTTIFLVTSIISAIEFLVLGIWKIYEIFNWSMNYFILSIIFPIIAVITLAILLIKS